jgi:hypothetical protein|tara:strand:- start:368 stop:706 length:339 start_codon:yes stop_codon:yes gene_type:complete
MNYKIEDRLQELGLWYDYVNDGSCNLLTIKMPVEQRHRGGDKIAYFTCPFCVSKYKKNGNPYKYAKPVVHVHGSGNGLGTRTAHCCVNAKALWELPPLEFDLVGKMYTLKFE